MEIEQLLEQVKKNEPNYTDKQIQAVIELTQQGATIPFIARYRKERTGSLDETQIEAILKSYRQTQEICKRKETVLNTIRELNLLTPSLEERILKCWDSIELEDIYLPYKPKKRTRAEIAKEKGLEPLADQIFKQYPADLTLMASKYISDTVSSVEEALKGARDIIAERISEDEKVRRRLRSLFQKEGVIQSKVVKGKETEGNKYGDWFDFSEPIKRSTSHRYLALRRGEAEGFLKVSIQVDSQEAVEIVNKLFVTNNTESSFEVKTAAEDAYKRLLKPSIENETAALWKEKSDQEAIAIFAENLKQLLMAPALGQKRVMGIDPGFRTGCKIVCLDAQGNLLHNETIYPHPPQMEAAQAANKLRKMVEAYKIEAIAIGNGTAGRETETFIANQSFDRKVQLFSVSEQGASIYSASKIAREEFPQWDVTVRGAISIGRRLMDPLAELVKIEPKSIGVGQYQHDVEQNALKGSLDRVVESCVNAVGVELNTASKQLLTYISGLGPQLAQNIVDYRSENGPFQSRKELMNVKRMGSKAFEQAAGFLRIRDSVHPLDNTAVHPERYVLVEKIARERKTDLSSLIADKEQLQQIDPQQYVSQEVGLPTLQDILRELEKPGRDPRPPIKMFSFDDSIRKLEDLKIGMVLNGIVTNITQFGCFVDVGIKENGLVHLSQMANRFISDPNEVVSIHQQIQVKVIGIDNERRRIQLSLKDIN